MTSFGVRKRREFFSWNIVNLLEGKGGFQELCHITMKIIIQIIGPKT